MDVSPYPGDNRVKTFTLPVSGSVRLFGPEIDIVMTREFQRLGGIRQLGTAYMVYRGAVHTRFEHSLGTVHRAEQMVQAINWNPRGHARVDDRGRRLARLGALLHDLPHVPFGHTIEDELGLLRRHDTNDDRIRELLHESAVGEILRSLPGDEREELFRLLAAKTDAEVAALSRPYAADIVGNTVCADALDYVPRDMYACGLPGQLGERFLDYLTITPQTCGRLDRGRTGLRIEKDGMPRPDVESEVVKLLTYRYELAERVYFHHAKNSGSVMIGRAVVDSGLIASPLDKGDTPESFAAADEQSDRNLRWLSDDLLLKILSVPALAAPLGLKLFPRDAASLARSAKLGSALVDRRLYKIAYLAVRDDLLVQADDLWRKYGKPDTRRHLEDELAAMAALQPGQVLLHLPVTKMLAKLAEVRIVTEAGDVLTLDRWDRMHSRRFAALIDAHERLWRVTVYIDPAATAEQEALVGAAATDALHASSRYRPSRRPSAYLDHLFALEAPERGWTVADREALVEVFALREENASKESAVAHLQALIEARRAAAADPIDGEETSA